MKLTDLSEKFVLKYAEEVTDTAPDTIKDPVPDTIRTPAPQFMKTKVQVAPKAAIDLIIQHCEENGVLDFDEAKIYLSWSDRGDSPKHLLNLMKDKIQEAQNKLNNCKTMIKDWGKLVK